MRRRQITGRWHSAALVRVLVVAGLAVLVGVVYVVLVLGGGSLIGQTQSPNLALSVVATATVALLINPAQQALERAATRLVHRTAVAPYDVLAQFAESATSGYDAAEVPSRMARLLAEGTGAAWAQVWLSVSGRLTLAATWPSNKVGDRTPPVTEGTGQEDGSRPGRRELPVRHGGEILGVLRFEERPGLGLTPVEERLAGGLAAQAGLVLRLAGLRAEMEVAHADLVARAAELRNSRGRLIAAQDHERRRLERDIHDGAQQHLVALVVNLRLAQTVAARSPARASGILAEQATATRAAIETLSLLSRGIYPHLLSDKGLVPALTSAVAASAIATTLEAKGVDRLPATLEAALYFCCMEAVQNAAKHSAAQRVTVTLQGEGKGCRLVVSDDGSGFEPAGLPDTSGSGLLNMRDRIDAVGGTLTVASAPGSGTTVTALVGAG